MIVVDSNVIAYCVLRGPRTPSAHRVLQSDPDWHAPVLWRSELRNVFGQYIRRKAVSVQEAMAMMAAAEHILLGAEHLVRSAAVLELAAFSGLSAYDCEFVALAEALGAPLVTEDAALLRAFPDRALTMDAFLDSRREPPGAHSPPPRYGPRSRRAKSIGPRERAS